MGIGNWLLKRGAPGQAAKIVGKMYVNSKLKEPQRPNLYHLLGVLFMRWAIIPLPGNREDCTMLALH